MRWFHETVDDLMLPLLKVMAAGYRERMPSFRAGKVCSTDCLESVEAPEQVAIQSLADWRGFAVERYEFDSPVHCRHADNQQVKGLLLYTDRSAPWVVIVPGFATGAIQITSRYGIFQDLYGRAALENGFNVALIDLPFHLERKPPGHISGERFFSPDLADTQNAVIQAAGDTIALVRCLQQRFGGPVALWGTSLGGCVSGLAATQLANLSALALMEPLDNPGDAMATLPACADIRKRLAQSGVSPRDLTELFRPVAPSTYEPKCSRERILFVTPLYDRVVDLRFQEDFWEAWGRPRRISVHTGHVGLHAERSLPPRVLEFVRGWSQPL